MKLANTHISYCTNIHGGESWLDHFQELKAFVPSIKKAVAPNQSFGLGLRLSAKGAKELMKASALKKFSDWLLENDLYIFTLNGFPFGDFHLNRVKDKVHFPDWTTKERLDYTLNLFEILSVLLKDGTQGGISTSPLSYRYWFDEKSIQWLQMREKATRHIVEVADYLYQKEVQTACYMHLDIEPEPDGILENGKEFIDWYQKDLLKEAISYFNKKYGLDNAQIKLLINRYICICYDVCHFALEYENHQEIIQEIESLGIKIGKFQVSSALKVNLSSSIDERNEIKSILQEFDEPIYLHQVIAKTNQGELIKYRDLSDALPFLTDLNQVEWRSHFHVPIFLENYGKISSTQSDILEVLKLQKQSARTAHIEVETYTWGVLPKGLQIPIEDSISREINWMLEYLKKD